PRPARQGAWPGVEACRNRRSGAGRGAPSVRADGGDVPNLAVFTKSPPQLRAIPAASRKGRPPAFRQAADQGNRDDPRRTLGESAQRASHAMARMLTRVVGIGVEWNEQGRLRISANLRSDARFALAQTPERALQLPASSPRR